MKIPDKATQESLQEALDVLAVDNRLEIKGAMAWIEDVLKYCKQTCTQCGYSHEWHVEHRPRHVFRPAT